MAPKVVRPSVKCARRGCTGHCPLRVIEAGFKPGKKRAVCLECGQEFPKPNFTLEDFIVQDARGQATGRKPKKDHGGRPNAHEKDLTKQLAAATAKIAALESAGAAQDKENGSKGGTADADLPTHVAAELKQNEKLRKLLATMPADHRDLIYGDRYDEVVRKAEATRDALLAQKRRGRPLKAQLNGQQEYVDRATKEIGEKRAEQLQVLNQWAELDDDIRAREAKLAEGRAELARIAAAVAAEDAIAPAAAPVPQHTSPALVGDGPEQRALLLVLQAALAKEANMAQLLQASGATGFDLEFMDKTIKGVVQRLQEAPAVAAAGSPAVAGTPAGAGPQPGAAASAAQQGPPLLAPAPTDEVDADMEAEWQMHTQTLKDFAHWAEERRATTRKQWIAIKTASKTLKKGESRS